MSTIVEFIAALTFSFLGISEEIPPEVVVHQVTIECCETEPSSSTDMLMITDISSIKKSNIKAQKNTLL